MADVFLSYASEDRDRVRPVVNYLTEQGWSVWWDRSLGAGETWPEVIEKELYKARSVVVAWSMQSVDSSWVRLEALRARKKKILVPFVLDDVVVPPEFSLFQAVDLREHSQASLQLIAEGVLAHLKRRTRRVVVSLIISIVLLLVLIGTSACIWTSNCIDPTSSILPQHSLAVMTFKNATQEQEPSQIAEVFSDELRSDISKIEGQIVSSKVAISAIPKEMSPEDIGERLHVRWLLTGSVSLNHSGLRFAVDLIDASTGYLKENWNYDTSLRKFGDLRSRMVRDILNAIGSDLGHLPAPSGSEITSAQSDAYILYLRGKSAILESHDEAHLSKAEDLFDDALVLQPGYELADAGLCQVSLHRYQTTRAVEHFQRGEEHCNRALSGDESSADAAVALGWLYFHEGKYDLSNRFFSTALLSNNSLAEARIGLGYLDMVRGRQQEAERNFRLAIALQPGYWRGYNDLGSFLFKTGRTVEAITQQNTAIELMAIDAPGLNNLGASYFMSGQFSAAVKAWGTALTIQEQAPTYSNLGVSYYYLGRYRMAAEMYNKAIRLQPEDHRHWSNLGDAYGQIDGMDHLQAYARADHLLNEELLLNTNNGLARLGRAAVQAALGKKVEALMSIERGLKDSPLTWETAYLAALTYVRLDDDAKALHYLSVAAQSGYPPILIEKDPAFSGLHGQEIFDQLIVNATQ